MKFTFNFKGLDLAVKTNELHKDIKHDTDVNAKFEELAVTIEDVNISEVAGLTKEIAGLLKAQTKEVKPAEPLKQPSLNDAFPEFREQTSRNK